MRTFRVGIIGCGRKASTIDDENRWLTNYDVNPCSHASAYKAIEQTQVVAVANRSPEKLAAFKARWGECATYADYRQMLERERLDIVSVCTHAPLHAPMTIDAANAGVKGILCEKAMATSLSECDEMIAACERKNVKLLINHPRRFHPTFRKVKEILGVGQASALPMIDGRRDACTRMLGDLKSIISTGYNKLLHNGSHAFDILRYLAGEATSVRGELVEADDPEDVDGRAIVKMKNGVNCLVDFASQQPFGFQLWFTDGRIVIDQFTEGFLLRRFVPENPNETGPWFRYRPKKQIPEHFRPEPRYPMQEAVRELVGAIDQNRQPESNGYEGRAALEMALAVHSSEIEGGSPVCLPLKDKALTVRSR